MIKKSIGLLALSALLLFGTSCSKENGAAKSPLEKKTTGGQSGVPTSQVNVLAAINSFSEDIHGILVDGDPLDGVSDESFEYGEWLMEATFNSQHATPRSSLEAIEQQELVEYEIMVSLGSSGNTLQGASMADKFIETLIHFENQLNTGDEFYSSVDFTIEEVTANAARISVSGLKAVAGSIPTGPITDDDDWYSVGNQGTCNGIYTTGNAAQRMSPLVLKMNYTWPGNIPPNKLYFFSNVNREKIGYNYYFNKYDNFLGSTTNLNYCDYVYGVDNDLEAYCYAIKIGFGPNDITCIQDQDMIHYINHMDEIVDNEMPTGKLFVGSICTAAQPFYDVNSGWNYCWHRFEARYGNHMIISDLMPINLRYEEMLTQG